MLKKAIILMVLSALAFALLNTFVKSLDKFNVYQIVFFRSLGTLFFTIPLIFKKKLDIFGNKKALLISRGIIGFIAMTLFFMSLKHLTIGTAVSIRYIAPIFAAIFALFFLKEKTRPIQWLCFLVAFVGVILLKGFDDSINNYGLVLILFSAVFTGVVFIIIRKIGNQDHPLIVVNYFMFISVIFGGILSINYWVNPVGLEWLFLLVLGVFGYFGQYYMTKAFQTTEINQIAPFKYMEVIFSMIIGALWLNESYTFYSLLGISLILIGLFFNIKLKEKDLF